MPSEAPRPGNQREHILDQALTLMSEQGSAGMSMRQLAQACGVQVAAIYHYFPSKDALLRSVFEERQYTTRLEFLAIDAGGSAEDRLRAVFDTFWAGMLDEEPVLRLLLGEALRREPVALPMGSALLEVFRTGVRMLLEQYVPEVSDVDRVTEVVVAQVFSGFIRHIFEPDTDTAVIGAELVQLLVDTVLPGTVLPGALL